MDVWINSAVLNRSRTCGHNFVLMSQRDRSTIVQPSVILETCGVGTRPEERWLSVRHMPSLESLAHQSGSIYGYGQGILMPTIFWM